VCPARGRQRPLFPCGADRGALRSLAADLGASGMTILAGSAAKTPRIGGRLGGPARISLSWALGNATAAKVRLIVSCKDCSHQVEPNPAEMAAKSTVSSIGSNCFSSRSRPWRVSGTLRSHPRGGLRTDRGRRGLLLLHRSGLSPHTPCRSPGALIRVAACTLARSPYIVTAIRRLQTLRLLHVCSGRFRLERSPGGACTHWKSAAWRTWKADISRRKRVR
jgi:hypothetical protein